MGGQFDGLGRGVGPRPGDHPDTARRDFDAEFDDSLVLVMAERRGLARGPHRHDAVDAGVDLALQQDAEGFLVQHPVAEGSDQGRDRAREGGLEHDLQIAVTRPRGVAAGVWARTLCRGAGRLQQTVR